MLCRVRVVLRELNRNRIRQVEGLTFQGLSSLEVLKLQRNNISKLTDGAFWDLAKMKVLYVIITNLSLLSSRAGRLIEFKPKSDFFFNRMICKNILIDKSIFTLIRVNMYGSRSFKPRFFAPIIADLATH